ncbi:MAG: hypothetical protein IAE84_12175 [Saprospiraceae bacterium]|nr:hypothetical protein [Saprospiraceae bacterium]
MRLHLPSITRYTVAVAALFCIAAAMAGAVAGHHKAIQFIAHLAGQSDKAHKIEAAFPPGKFWALLGILLLFGVALGIAFRFVNIWLPYPAAGLRYALQSTRQTIVSFAASPAKYLLILPVAASVYYALTLPVNYDEAWTYLNFTSKSPIVSLAYYPVPNNHILHSLITNFTRYLPGLSVLSALRVSSIFVNIGIWVLAWQMMRSRYKDAAALALVGIGSVVFMTIYYSCMSRGYAWVNLFFMGAWYASFLILQEGGRLRHWAMWAVCSIGGFFTMPSFLYPVLALNAWIFWQQPGGWRRQMYANLATAVTVAILYLPAVLFSGIKALAANPFVQPISRSEVFTRLPEFFAGALEDVFGMPFYIPAALILGSLLLLALRRDRFHTKMGIVFALAPWLLLLLHSVIPFSRTFAWYALVIPVLVLIPWAAHLQRLPSSVLMSALLIFQVWSLWNFHQKIGEFEQYNTTYHKINQEIAGPHSYYFNTRTFDTNLLFELRIRGFEPTKQQRNFPPLYMSADSISGFDYIIIDKPFDLTKNRKPTFSDPYVNIYSSENAGYE